jgi:Ribonuclease G/E
MFTRPDILVSVPKNNSVRVEKIEREHNQAIERQRNPWAFNDFVYCRKRPRPTAIRTRTRGRKRSVSRPRSVGVDVDAGLFP